MHGKLIRTACVLVVVLAAAALPGAAQAAPGNDEFASATVVDPSTLPFGDQQDIGSASSEIGEPQYCYFTSQTVWYAITPSTTTLLRVSSAGSTFSDAMLNLYRQDGSSFGGLTHLSCGTWGGSVTLTAQAGVTYYVQAAKQFGGGGTMSVNVQEILPPPNDDFADATAVATVPFVSGIDTAAATLEPGEPTPAGCYVPTGSAWYAFTPPASGSYTASASASFSTQVAAYTGSGLGNLTDVGCRTFGGLTFHANAGQTVYFQVGGIFNSSGPVSFSVVVAPEPVVNLNYGPGDPSVFDNVPFYDYSYDPAGVGFASRSWDFGDGSGSSDQYPTHRYATDGTYTVRLTVTTYDGRTQSATQPLVVKTHDVSIAKVGVPQTGNVGQSRQITVGLTNDRYAENVQAVLYKSVAGGGWQQVGALTQWVPVRGPNRTTNFAFSYTFAPEDALLGKITFQAVAVIQGARDAIPTDNTFISLATKVNG